MTEEDKLSYFRRRVILKFYFDFVEQLDAMAPHSKHYEDMLEHDLNCRENVRNEK